MRALLSSLPLRPMAVLFAAHLAVIGLGATLTGGDAGLFNLDGEGPRWFVVFSSAVLVAGAVVAVVVRTLPALVFGAFLAFMAIDEAFQVHESLERELGVDWPILYSPVMAAAAIAALALLRRHRDVPGFAPTLLAGGGCWAIAVVLEKLQWTASGAVDHYVALMVPEELLEATGSYLFAVALALVVRSVSQGRSERRAWDAATADGLRGAVGHDAQLGADRVHVPAEVGQGA